MARLEPRIRQLGFIAATFIGLSTGRRSAPLLQRSPTGGSRSTPCRKRCPGHPRLRAQRARAVQLGSARQRLPHERLRRRCRRVDSPRCAWARCESSGTRWQRQRRLDLAIDRPELLRGPVPIDSEGSRRHCPSRPEYSAASGVTDSVDPSNDTGRPYREPLRRLIMTAVPKSSHATRQRIANPARRALPAAVISLGLASCATASRDSTGPVEGRPGSSWRCRVIA